MNEQTIANLEAKIEELKSEVQKLKQPDNNAFVKMYEDSTPEKLQAFSKEAFGDIHAIQIGHNATPVGREDLTGKSLFVDLYYKVIIHNGRLNGTVIEIQKINP